MGHKDEAPGVLPCMWSPTGKAEADAEGRCTCKPVTGLPKPLHDLVITLDRLAHKLSVESVVGTGDDLRVVAEETADSLRTIMRGLLDSRGRDERDDRIAELEVEVGRLRGELDDADEEMADAMGLIDELEVQLMHTGGCDADS